MSEVFIVIQSWGTPKREEISGVYASGLDALMHDAGEVSWTATDEDTDGVLFTGLTRHADSKYRIERWPIQ